MTDVLAHVWLKTEDFLIGRVYAQGDIPLIDGTDDFSTSPTEAINRIIAIAVGVAIAVGIILVAAAGYRMMSSGGDAAKLKDARDQLQNAILGLILVLAAVTIMGIIFNIIGIEGIL